MTWSSSALMGVLVASLLTPGRAEAQTFCATAAGVSSSVAPEYWVSVYMLGATPYIASATFSSQTAHVGIVADAYQISGATYITLYNSSYFTQTITGWAVLMYKC